MKYIWGLKSSVTPRSSLLLYCNRSDAEFALLTNCRFLLFLRVATTAITHPPLASCARVVCLAFCLHLLYASWHPLRPRIKQTVFINIKLTLHLLFILLLYICRLMVCKLLYSSGSVASTNCCTPAKKYSYNLLCKK